MTAGRGFVARPWRGLPLPRRRWAVTRCGRVVRRRVLRAEPRPLHAVPAQRARRNGVPGERQGLLRACLSYVLATPPALRVPSPSSLPLLVADAAGSSSSQLPIRASPAVVHVEPAYEWRCRDAQSPSPSSTSVTGCIACRRHCSRSAPRCLPLSFLVNFALYIARIWWANIRFVRESVSN